MSNSAVIAGDVGTHHIDPVMSQLVADLLTGSLIERSILLMNTTTINGCRKVD